MHAGILPTDDERFLLSLQRLDPADKEDCPYIMTENKKTPPILRAFGRFSGRARLDQINLYWLHPTLVLVHIKPLDRDSVEPRHAPCVPVGGKKTQDTDEDEKIRKDVSNVPTRLDPSLPQMDWRSSSWPTYVAKAVSIASRFCRDRGEIQIWESPGHSQGFEAFLPKNLPTPQILDLKNLSQEQDEQETVPQTVNEAFKARGNTTTRREIVGTL